MKYATLTFFIFLFLGCDPPSSKPRVSSEVKKIDSFLQGLVERLKIPGLTVAATRNDSIVYVGAFGFRNIETREHMKPSYNFHWASVSKTFVATAILQLVEEQKLKLDDSLITHVPYFKHQGEDYKRITIRQMLNHTSGIGDVKDYEWDKPQNDDAAPERFVRSLENDSLVFAPGTDWRYSNTAFDILAVVIANVSGMPFETYIRENIFSLLDMEHSSFIYLEIPDSLRVSGHVWAAGPIASKVYPYNKIHAPSSTLNSNVLEMTHYAMANLHHGVYGDNQILSDSSYHLLWTNSVNLKDKPAVGVGWFLSEHKGLKTVSHSGGDTGFGSFLLLVPDKNISVMVACNYELAQTGGIAHGVLDLLIDQEPADIKRQIGFAFAEVLAKEGIAKAKSFYKKANEDSTQHKYYFWKEEDGAMTYPGDILLEQKMFKEALDVFKFNVELNPNSGQAYGHLGVAYAGMENKDSARINLMKAIELVPSEEYFKSELKKLDEKPMDEKDKVGK